MNDEYSEREAVLSFEIKQKLLFVHNLLAEIERLKAELAAARSPVRREGDGE